MLGQELYHESAAGKGTGLKTLNTSNWPDGVYLISVETSDGLVSKILVKE